MRKMSKTAQDEAIKQKRVDARDRERERVRNLYVREGLNAHQIHLRTGMAVSTVSAIIRPLVGSQRRKRPVITADRPVHTDLMQSEGFKFNPDNL